MGCDIHSFAEVKDGDFWYTVNDEIFGEKDTSEPFGWRQYGVFAFLAGVRNYSDLPEFDWHYRGFPENSDYLQSDSGWNNQTIREEIENDYDYHSTSFIYLNELLNFNYDQKFENRRITVKTGPNSYDGAGLARKGEGEMTTYRDFLGNSFFEDIEVLKTLGTPENVRVFYYFDN